MVKQLKPKCGILNVATGTRNPVGFVTGGGVRRCTLKEG